MATGPQQLSTEEAQNVVMEVKVAETTTSKGCLVEGEPECADVEKVLCFCGNDRESGEMACCELCSGWFHFRCMRFKEKVDLLEKRDFVCCFCLASKTLALLREVDALKEEVKELRGVMKLSGCERSANVPVLRTSSISSAAEISDDNVGEGDAKKQTSSDSGTSYSAVVVRGGKSNAHPSTKKPKEGSKTVRKTSRARTSMKRENLSKPREFVGRRKLWGTKRADSAEKVRESIVKKVPEAASVEVKRVFKNDDGRVRWWFWLEGEESVLKLIDGANFGDFWKIETRPSFLEPVVVRVLGLR